MRCSGLRFLIEFSYVDILYFSSTLRSMTSTKVSRISQSLNFDPFFLAKDPSFRMKLFVCFCRWVSILLRPSWVNNIFGLSAIKVLSGFTPELPIHWTILTLPYLISRFCPLCTSPSIHLYLLTSGFTFYISSWIFNSISSVNIPRCIPPDTLKSVWLLTTINLDKEYEWNNKNCIVSKERDP